MFHMRETGGSTDLYEKQVVFYYLQFTGYTGICHPSAVDSAFNIATITLL